MKTLFISLIASLILITNCTKDDDSYGYGEKPKPSPSYENINN
jgi:hypothetical protein